MHMSLLITLEGIDGSGKSTLARDLNAALTQAGHKVVLTKEPGATSLGRTIREKLDAGNIDPKAEFLLFGADRAQHFTELVLPSLADGKIVLSDRMADSSLAYQGYGRGLDKDMIQRVSTWTMQGRMPDVTFFVDVAIDVALERIARTRETKTSFEQEQVDFWQRVRDGYKEIFQTRDNVITLDGSKPPEQVLADAMAALKHYLAA